MTPVTDGLAGASFCVVVHDVTPFFAGEIDRIVEALRPLIGNRVAGAVVPQWHGSAAGASARRYFRRWSSCFGDFLLHGRTHQRESKWGPISWCTDGADEFTRRSRAETVDRLRRAQIEAQELLGRTLRGFVPPAWQLATSLADVHAAGIDYLMRFGRLEALHRPTIPLATWSWDWGWLPGIHLPGTALGAWRQWFNPLAVPTVVVHPQDVRRGRLPAALRLIRRFLSSGLAPALPCDLIAPETLGEAS
jgi:peptidoglycan/xylan/chitin deacetylase (PgdA/CDA1 family)